MTTQLNVAAPEPSAGVPKSGGSRQGESRQGESTRAESTAKPDPTPPSAEVVEARLLEALDRLDHARRDAVTWFGEVLERKLYLSFDCSSIYQYARVRLGFSRTRTAYFLRLVRAFEDLPRLRESVETGEVPWTKAREVVKVATSATEAMWVEEARTSSRRELERKVAVVRGRQSRRRRTPGQGEMALRPTTSKDGVAGPGGGPDSGVGMGPCAPADDPRRDMREIPVELNLRFSPEQFARFEALVERARRCGERGSREELLLAGLEALGCVAGGLGGAGVGDAESSNTPTAPSELVNVHLDAEGSENSGCAPHPDSPLEFPPAKPPRKSLSAAPANLSQSRYQVVVYDCETCGQASIPSSRGSLPLSDATLRTLLCDARVLRPGKRNRATVPPAVRRGVLIRDGHRCTAPGCGSTRFLDVHHVVPRSAGGGNESGNLVTICAGCHRLLHGIMSRGGDGKVAALANMIRRRMNRVRGREVIGEGDEPGAECSPG